MAKNTDAQIEDTEIVLEDETIDQEAETAKLFAKEAQENPDLYAFLAEQPQPGEDGAPKSEKSTLFLVDTKPYAAAKGELENLTFRRGHLARTLEDPEQTGDLTDEQLAEFNANLADFDAQLPELQETVDREKEKLFARAVVVEMVTPHKIAQEKAERRARKATPGRRGNEELQIRYDQIVTIELLARCIRKVTLPGGVDATGTNKLATARMLDKLLPISQWRRLITDMNELLYSDAARDLALADPGFLAES